MSFSHYLLRERSSSKHCIGSCDNSGVRLIASLGGDHVGEFLSKVNVGHLKCAGYDLARAFLTCDSNLRLTGSYGLFEQSAADSGKTVRVIECSNVDTAKVQVAVYRMLADDGAVLLNGHVLKILVGLLAALASISKVEGGKVLSYRGVEAVLAAAERK